MGLPKVLFLVKKSQKPFSYSHNSSGLYNSARFVSEMLSCNYVDSKIVEVVDANQIDKELHHFKPKICIIEAYWVTPDKFKELKKLHPKVEFIVRNHSNPEFLAQEGSAFEWSFEYLKLGIKIACNSEKMVRALKAPLHTHEKGKDLFFYLPNYYINEVKHPKTEINDYSEFLDIGCFGAIRVLKNQVNQALAAIKVAKYRKQRLRFHINGTRVEGGENILKNLRAIFKDTEHELIEHPWLNHKDFLDLTKQMDLVTQVSMSETFCIVAADAIACRVPVLVSSEIVWIGGELINDPETTDLIGIFGSMNKILRLDDKDHTFLLDQQTECLREYNAESKEIWLDFVFNGKLVEFF